MKRLSILALLSSTSAFAGVLPEDRADLLYHRYDGGGITPQKIHGVSGPITATLKAYPRRATEP